MTAGSIAEAFKYAGLYAYDFGTHISFGYTAGEIAVLRGSEAHRGGRVLAIYRINEAGGFELRGARDEDIGGREAMAFLRGDAGAARRDYDTIVAAAKDDPLPCPVEAQLARLYGFDPANVTSLAYPIGAGTAVASWLTIHRLDLGDRVRVGRDVNASVAASDGLHISGAQLPALMCHDDRPPDLVLQSVACTWQR